MKQDVLMYYRASILCDTAGKSDLIQLGEIVQIGEAWKLIDAPIPGDAPSEIQGASFTGARAGSGDPKTNELVKKLAEMDANPPRYPGFGVNPAVATYQMARADIIEPRCPSGIASWPTAWAPRCRPPDRAATTRRWNGLRSWPRSWPVRRPAATWPPTPPSAS
jgi:hypothetical protein